MKKKAIVAVICIACALCIYGCGNDDKTGNMDEASGDNKEIEDIDQSMKLDIEADPSGQEDSAEMKIVHMPLEEDEGKDVEINDNEDEKSLPKYKSAQSGSIEEAITLYMWDQFGFGQTDKDTVNIPAYVIFKTELAENDITRVYGDFYVYGYRLEDKNMLSESGGSFAGAFNLRQNENGYEVASFDMVEDGSGYDESIKNICNGDEELIKKFYDCSDAVYPECIKSRISFLKWYAYDNELEIESYQDNGLEPVSLNTEINIEEKQESDTGNAENDPVEELNEDAAATPAE